ncbi:flagellar biosynthesis protein [Clostridium beijerinckii]|jgi:flagellar operon protein|uniref:Flagellar biosynthesis protein n=2 Tax=Clostridium beijerinckii TaxID=1520 RepID=A0AAE2RT07_CLOBE|nr:flagellar biosynthesis protein [Clostridium beijerinckii]ABR36371.1 flagellar operon protein [Clostridium beijerinckii NCIMB 8052]AIU04292.1 flagellar operon protein [Clostridium beijerinckii ATCC 35702]MBF7808983.1 flagellar biosynthesis protein [Clostridium beijerinckii]MCI1477696.1 flagellar biosynthesis protein [Clostridium beijerinckii]MCI1577988.1 flagellar biosynthesis protein [Clostridium beijerinckii]
MSYRIINGQAYSVGNIGQFANSQKAIGYSPNSKQKEARFQDVLDSAKSKEQSFTVSKHAASRLNEINFTKEDMEQIQKGFKIAQDRNSKNTVMLYKDVALIASIENKTLITAVEKDRAKDNIFTNVDSVVIL